MFENRNYLCLIIVRLALSSENPIVRIKLDALAIRASEELIDREIGSLAQDVPKGNVDGAYSAQEDAALPHPVEIFVQLCPDIIDPAGILADQVLSNELAR